MGTETHLASKIFLLFSTYGTLGFGQIPKSNCKIPLSQISRNGFTVLLVTYLSIQEDCKQHLLVEPVPSSSKVLNLYTGTEDPNSLWKIQTFCKNIYSKWHFRERETVAEVTFTVKKQRALR